MEVSSTNMTFNAHRVAAASNPNQGRDKEHDHPHLGLPWRLPAGVITADGLASRAEPELTDLRDSPRC